jgi:ABC-type branched-subunit amino acid transport system permease subunit
MKKMRKATKQNMITYLLVIVLFALMQGLSSAGLLTNQIQGLLIPLCVYIIAAISLNLVVGISGELSLGHAGFMCLGAFFSAIFSKIVADSMPAGLRFFLALLIGAAVAGVFGILIGIPVLRLNGDYLAIVTLAFGEIIKNIMNVFYVGKDSSGIHVAMQDATAMHLDSDGETILKGAQGISGTPKNSTFLIGFILILVTLFIVQNIIDSRTGRAIMSIRDNRIAAESIGIDVTKYKMLAFSVSAALAGMAGALYSHNLASLTVKKFDYNTSILILVFVVLGGIGNIRGSIIATILLYLLPELLRFLQDYRMLIYAIVLILMMLFNWAPAAIAWRERFVEKFKKNKSKGVA